MILARANQHHFEDVPKFRGIFDECLAQQWAHMKRDSMEVEEWTEHHQEHLKVFPQHLAFHTLCQATGPMTAYKDQLTSVTNTAVGNKLWGRAHLSLEHDSYSQRATSFMIALAIGE